MSHQPRSWPIPVGGGALDRIAAGLLSVALSVGLANPAWSHHGASLYDTTRTVTVRGSVTQFKFVFPHTLVYVAVTDADGRTVEWSGELTTPNRLARGVGGGAATSIKWTAHTLQPGDVIELTGSPARNGAPSMRIEGIVDANGRALIGGEALSMEKAAKPVGPLPAGQGADLRGVWMRRYEHRYENYAFTEEPPAMTPWAAERFSASKPAFGPDAVPVAETNDPIYRCLPPGVPRIYAHPAPFEIFQHTDRVVIVYEFQHEVRQVYTDGRGHREGRPASWMGDPIGHWEGETLVVESTHFNDKTWIDRRGVPHSDQLQVTERIYRSGDDELTVDLRVEDPVAFSEPWTARRIFDRVGWTLEENVCVDSALFEEFSQFERGVLDYEAQP